MRFCLARVSEAPSLNISAVYRSANTSRGLDTLHNLRIGGHHPEGSVIAITRNQDVKKEAAAKCQMRHDVCAAYAVKGRTENKL